VKSVLARLARTERVVRVGTDGGEDVGEAGEAVEDDGLRALRSFCTSHNARLVFEDSLPAGRCRVVVDDEVVATDDLADVRAYLSAPGATNAPARRSPVIDAVVGSESAVRAASTAEMVRVSREVERRAWRTSGGTLRAGFQRLSTMARSGTTRDRYERLVEAGVDVTVYGVPDVSVDDAGFEVRPDPDGSLRDYWFVLYDGDGRPPRAAALVCEQTDSDEFSGYWTRDASVVADCFVAAAVEHPDLLGGVPGAVERLRENPVGVGVDADAASAEADADVDADADASR
jgi:DICT domain-containing protein